MTLMWRRYTPKTNRLSRAMTFNSHLPLDGSFVGVDGDERGRLLSTLTKRTMSGPTGMPAK